MSSVYAKCISDLLQRCTEAQSIYSIRQKPTLKPMRLLCDRMKNPQNTYKCIHIGGTNGKGSTSTKLAASLSLCGYRVGLFTSPHISCIRERIRINDKMISKRDFVNDFNKIIHYENDINIKLTYFEILNAMAFYHFKRIGVDFAIIEVGVGGTWDSTNIINQPLLSIIVSISLDHTKLLGNTIQQIAADKCGIIKEGRPTVIGPTVPYKIAKAKADLMRSDLYQMNIDEIGPFDTYDEHNSNLAKYALEILCGKYFILPKNINELSKALIIRPHCRMEIIKINLYKLFKRLCHKSSKTNHSLISNTNRKWLKKFITSEINYNKYKHCIKPIEIILDVAHNSDAFEQLFKSLIKTYSPLQYSYRIILGVNPKKKIKSCLNIICEYADYIHLVSSQRNKEYSCNINKLKKILIEYNKYDINKIFIKGNGNIFMEVMYALNECYLHNNYSKMDINYSMESTSDGTNSTNSEKDNKSEMNEFRNYSKKKNSKAKYKTEIIIVTGSFYIMSDVRKSLALRFDDDYDDLIQYQKLNIKKSNVDNHELDNDR